MSETRQVESLGISFSLTERGAAEPAVKLPRGEDLVFPAGNTEIAVRRDATTTLPVRRAEVHSIFQAQESWVGRVTEVDKNERKFEAIVISSAQKDLQEVASFSFDEISADDAGLLIPGAVFYWSVGYEVSEFGRRSTASVVRFRRTYHWTRRELEAAQARAEQYSGWFLGGIGDGGS